MKKWTKPELYVEKFELSQIIAAGCGTKVDGITITPGGTVKVSCGCIKNNGNFYNGEGHWYTEEDIKDTDGDGKIDFTEWKAAFDNVAKNGETTGVGHYTEHSTKVLVDGKVVDPSVNPFNS